MRLNKLSHKSINSWLLFAVLFAPVLYFFGALFTTQLGAHGSMNLAQGEEQFVPSSSYEESFNGSFGVNPYNVDYVYNASSFVPSNVFGNSVVIDDSIVDSRPTGFLSVGFNQWDEQWELTLQEGSQRVTSKYFIRVLPNTQYFVKTPNINNAIGGISFYDKDYNFIKLIYTSPDYVDGLFTTSSDCMYIKFYMPGGYGSTYNSDICINISNPSLNGVYKPFVSNAYSIPFPLMRSAGDVSDNLDFVNVGVVDLGTISFTRIGDSSGYLFDGVISGKANSNQGLCSKYEVNTVITSAWSLADKEMALASSSNHIFIRDDSYTDSDSFESSLAGVMLNYVLSTPIAQSFVSIPDSIGIFDGGSVYLKSNLVNSFQGMYFMYEGDYVLSPSSFSDYLFGQFFARDNFLAKSGKNVIEGTADYGFQPMAELIRFTDSNMLHLANLEYGYLMIGYAYYAIHVIFLDLIVYLTLFIPRLIRMLVERLEGGVDL